MNVYDHAHQLSRAIKDSREYRVFKKLDDEIASNPKLKGLIDDFRKKQYEIQSLQMMGKEIDEGMAKELQDLFEVIGKDPRAMEYFDAEMRLSQMMADVSKIITDAMS